MEHKGAKVLMKSRAGVLGAWGRGSPSTPPPPNTAGRGLLRRLVVPLLWVPSLPSAVVLPPLPSLLHLCA